MSCAYVIVSLRNPQCAAPRGIHFTSTRDRKNLRQWAQHSHGQLSRSKGPLIRALFLPYIGMGNSNESLCFIDDNMIADRKVCKLMNSRQFFHFETGVVIRLLYQLGADGLSRKAICDGGLWKFLTVRQIYPLSNQS